VGVPKINVYLPDDLAEAVKEAGLPVSPICQQALEVAVRRVTEIRETAKLDLTVDDPTARLTRFTAKARTAVDLAIARARQGRVTYVGTEHLLAGILEEGSNLAVQVLRSLEIEPDDVREALDARWPEPDVAEGDETAVAGRHWDPPAAEALKATLNEAIALAHNYIGCEHLLLGLVVDPESTAGQVLHSFGADHRSMRRAMLAALGGFVYAKSQGQGQPNPALLLQQALTPFSQRLEKLEKRMAELAGEPNDGE
jgi:ATP-dependent Clp protease ATP-binding subunit ClpA